jgi:hypothetical protein
MRVEVLSEQHIHTTKENVRSTYLRGDVFECEDEFVPQQIEEGNLREAKPMTSVSKPMDREKVIPAPAPTVPSGR